MRVLAQQRKKTTMIDLSVLIPARKEQYLDRTVQDILEHSKGRIEVLVGLDEYTSPSRIAELERNKDPRVQYVYVDDNIGQRAMTRKLAKLAQGRHIMKTDAHCSYGPGFDTALLEDIRDDMILAPVTFPLDAETWTVQHRKPMSNFYFDRNLVMQFNTEQPTELTETMCLQGSSFMLTRALYFSLGLDEPGFGSWGSQGVEIGCKGWLSGNRVMTTKNTYYAHLFRTTDADFPYDRGLNPGKEANEYAKRLFIDGEWKQGKHKLEWLVEKFGRPGDWK